MHTIEFNGEEMDICNTWDDVTLQNCIDLKALGMPACLKRFYDEMYLESDTDTNPKPFTKKNTQVDLPKYYRKVILLLSDFPEDMVNQLTPDDRATLYTTFLEQYVVGVWYDGNTYDYKRPESFTHNGVEYFFPRSIDLFGQERPMYEEPAITWMETDDILKAAHDMDGGRLDVAANIVSILCRPKAEDGKVEKYDEARSLERAQTFLDLPMSIVWEVFFCTHEQLHTFFKTSAYGGAAGTLNPRTQSRGLRLAPSAGTTTQKDAQKLLAV